MSFLRWMWDEWRATCVGLLLIVAFIVMCLILLAMSETP